MYTHAHTHTHARTRARAHTHTHTSVPTESLVHAQGLTVDSILEFRRCACLGPCIPHARIRARAALPARGAEEGGNMITMDMEVCRLCGSLVLIIDMRCDLHTLTQKRTARIQQRAQARICSSCLQRSGRPVPGWKAFTAAADRARSTEAEACGMAGNKFALEAISAKSHCTTAEGATTDIYIPQLFGSCFGTSRISLPKYLA